jgi:hypothetical protein
MVLGDRRGPPPGLAPPRYRIRMIAAGLALAVGLLYLVLLFLVRDAETGRPENTWGAYLFLSIAYLAGSWFLARFDERPLHVAGVLVQVVVFVLFLLFAVGGEHPGVFEYEALGGLHMAVWASVITGAQVVLLGLLVFLLVDRDDGVH